MCGIVGFFVTQNHDSFKNDLKKAVYSLKHRGPNQNNLWVDRDIGLGHARLSILDLSQHGMQPMHSRDGRYTIVYNGEIYNYLEIAKELSIEEKKVSDTRIILEAISLWGLDKAVRQFNGMFAFALWDNQEKELFLVRDSVGVKPLYWAKVGNGIIFASELKALGHFSKMNREINEQGLYQYFLHQYIPSPHSIYKESFKLLPGQIIKFKNGSFFHQEIFQPKTKSYQDISEQIQASDIFENILNDSLTRHLRSDVPVAAFLSGGIDSSLLVSLAVKRQSLKTFSVGYNESDFDESKRAEKIAHYLGTDHETLIITPDDIKYSLTSMLQMYDEPFADASCIPTHLLSKKISQDYKVAFSGDGADELFAGYPRYFSTCQQWQKIGRIPFYLRHILSLLMGEGKSNLLHFVSRLFLKNPQSSLPYIKSLLEHKNIVSFFVLNNYLGLPDHAFLNQDHWQIIKKTIEICPVNKGDFLSELLFFDQKNRLADGMLTKVDRASMATSLEIRVPFLDNEIVAFSRHVSSKFWADSSTPKPLLRSVLAKNIPEELFNYPKTGFHLPMKHWLRSHLQEWVDDLLSMSSVMNDDFLDMKCIRALWHNYRMGDNDSFYPVWSAINYLNWKEGQKVLR